MNEENAATSYADITRLNVYSCGIVINPSFPHLASSLTAEFTIRVRQIHVVP